MRNNAFFWILISLLFCVEISHLKAQELNFRIDEITTNNGLSNHTPRCIIQDSLGFLWFGTESGLNRFDGYDFKVFLNDRFDTNTISKNMIHDLFCDSNGDIWIGITNGGLNKYEQKYERFIRMDNSGHHSKNYSIDKGCIAEDKNKQLWVGYSYNGLSKIDLTSGRVKSFQHNPLVSESLSNNQIKSLCVDRDGLVWIGCADGYINIFDPRSETFTKLRVNDSTEHKSDQDIVRMIFEDSYGVLWISTESAFFMYDKKEKKFEQILRSKEGENHVVYGFITGIFEDTHGNIWAGGDTGLFMISRNTKSIINLSRHPDFLSRFKGKSIVSLFKDDLGIIWVGVSGQGIYKIDPTIKAFETIKYEIGNPNSLNTGLIRAIYTDKEKNLWISNIQNGLSVFSEGKKLVHFKSGEYKNNGLSNDVVTNITQDTNGYIWIATDGGGVNVIKNFDKDNPTTTQFEYFRHNPLDNSSIRSDNISSIYCDYNGKIWVSLSKGLELYDERTNSFIHVELNRNNYNLFSDIQSNCILKDKTGANWIGCWHGLVRFEYSISENAVNINNYQHFEHRPEYQNTISDNKITALHQDYEGNIWIGTFGGGLNKLRYNSETNNKYNKYIFENFTKQDGLPSDEILGIQEDKANNLWISTNNGLSKFNLITKTFKNYDISDGLLGNAFFWGASHKAADGKIFFGTTKGLNSFYPDSIKANRYIPQIVFTSLLVDTKEVKSSKYTISEKQLNYAAKLQIDYSVETFTIEFASLHYSFPNKNKYRYKLEPYNKKWTETDAFHRYATYTNLDPGTYVFKVMGTNNDGIWIEKPIELKVIITTPFWKTFLFKVVLVFLFALLIFSVYKIRINRVKKNNRKLESLINIKTAELRKKNEEVLEQNEEIAQQNYEIKLRSDEIIQQNEVATNQRDEIIKKNKELDQYRNHLEEIVIKRTEDLIKEKENAELADKLKTSFLENISHEIRTPLNVIVGFSDLLSEFGDINEDQLICVKNINKGSKALTDLIDSILQVSKLHAGEQKLKISEFYLEEVLGQLYEDSIEWVELRSKTNLKFEFELSNELKGKLIVGDKIVIAVVLKQLINNSIKFTNEGTVSFGASLNEKNNLCFFVKDTGIGIDNEYIKFVFDEFRKIETDKSKLYRGLGIGLSIAKNMVMLLGGHIWCESTINKGSVFYFTCPVEIVDKPIENNLTKRTLIKNINWQGKKILIAEDEELNFYFLEMALSNTKATIIWAKNGEEAMELYAKNQDIDLILMDIKMPVLDGVETLKMIRKDYSGKIPVIAQTAYGLADDNKGILDSGFDGYIEKPIDINKLFELMTKLIV